MIEEAEFIPSTIVFGVPLQIAAVRYILTPSPSYYRLLTVPLIKQIRSDPLGLVPSPVNIYPLHPLFNVLDIVVISVSRYEFV